MSAVAVALIGFAGLIAVQLLTYWLARRERRDVADETRKVAAALDASTAATAETLGATAETLGAIPGKLDEIHVLVNSRLSKALKRINQLSEKLGIPFVEDPDDDDDEDALR